MARKRKHIKQTREPERQGRYPKRTSYTKAASQILAFIYTHQHPVTLDDITTSLRTIKAKKIREEIATLIQQKKIFKSGKTFQLTDRSRYLTATLEMHKRGFGFAIDAEQKKAARHFEKDPFIGKDSIGSARHGDEILIKLRSSKYDNRPEADIIAVLTRGSETVVGFFRKTAPPTVIAEDPRFPAKIVIKNMPDVEIPENSIVLVQILPEKSGAPNVLHGEIREYLGNPDNIDVQMRIVIENHALPHIFPAEVLVEADKLRFSQEDYSQRADLRDTLHYTIDGETAKDFDDAVCIEKTEQGYRLFVSIADVSHFVAADSPLDREAYQRGTSIYFPGRVIPMLPENLSNNLCSLIPDEDRLTFTAILDFDDRGNLLQKNFTKSVICSKQRFTYTTVKQIVIDENADVCKAHQPFLVSLRLAKELAEKLYHNRMTRGAIGFNLPEPEILLAEDGKIESITRRERNFAHQIIEEFMLAANEAVAAIFSQAEKDFLYRIHEKPALDKVEEFSRFAATLGLELPPKEEEPSPSWFGRVLALAAGTPAQYVVNNLLLRTMQQARYSPVNQGHFGLAATDYTHFTSPIRRYPDLIVHRLLTDHIKKEKTPYKLPESADMHLSARERVAINSEREIHERLKIFYMENRIGEEFRAVISGLLETVIFVELVDLFISGSMDISLLRDDYYLYDIKRYRFIGEISGKTYTLGDEITVQLIDVDLRNRRIYFGPPGCL